MPKRKEQGFTLIEMVVVVAIIASLAAILVPVISEELASSEESKALGDIQRISAAVTQYIADTRYFPTGVLGAQTNDLLYSDGTAATSEGGTTKATLFSFICDGTVNGGTKFKGPYLENVAADPWGSRYVVNVGGYSSTDNVWILSAGPDRTFDTAFSAFKLVDDDIGILLD